MDKKGTGTSMAVAFPQEILGDRFGGLAVVKTAPETGILVCLSPKNGCSMSIRVKAQLSLGGVVRSEEFCSLGCWQDLDVRPAPLSSIGLDEGRLRDEEPEGEEAQEEYWASINRRLMEPRDRAVREACNRLGITSLLTGENANSEVGGLMIVRVPYSTIVVE